MATVNFSTNLALALPTTGDLSGTWGAETNSSITNMLDEALGYQAFTATGGTDTLTIPNGTTGVARSIYIQLNGTGGGTVNVPATKTKMYFVFNNTASAITFKVTGQTGVSIPASAKISLVSNGTDVIPAVNYYVGGSNLGSIIPFYFANQAAFPSAATYHGALAHSHADGAMYFAHSSVWVRLLDDSTDVTVAQGGTGLSTLTANNVIIGNGTSAPLFVAPSTNGNVLTSNGTTWASTAPATGGTVTSVSVASSNGFAGTVATATTTPAITLTTSITGVLKGNGTAISAATAGTDYVAPSTATTFTALQTFTGTSSNLAIVLNDAAEVATVSATAATGTINYDITTQSVLFFTTNASGNFTVNFRASSSTSLNTAMTTGQSVTAAFLVTNGATAYYNSVVQVDGSTVTPKYQGGTAYAAGNASSIDVYMYTIIKTGNAAFTVFTSQTKFA